MLPYVKFIMRMSDEEIDDLADYGYNSILHVKLRANFLA